MMLLVIPMFSLPVYAMSSSQWNNSNTNERTASILKNICKYGDKEYSNIRSNLKREFPKGSKLHDLRSILLEEFSEISSGKEVVDLFSSTKQHVLVFGYRKRCKGKDWEVAILGTKRGDIILSDISLYFDARVLSKGKAKFRFNYIRNNLRNSKPILSHLAVNKLNRIEVNELLIGAGATKITEDKKKIIYRYNVDPERNIRSRIIAWSFNLIIEVTMRDNGMVQDVQVYNR